MTETGSEPPAGLAFLRARATAGGVPQGDAEPARSDAAVGESDSTAWYASAAAGESDSTAGTSGAQVMARSGHADPAGAQAGEIVEGGEEGVEAALSALGRLDGIPVPEHVGVFEEVLTRLETALTSVDEPAGDKSR